MGVRNRLYFGAVAMLGLAATPAVAQTAVYNEPTVRREDEPATTAGLYGKVIVTGAGHGRTWSAGSWGWQREDWFPGRFRHSSQEDFNTARMVNRWLLPYLRSAGATVYPDRCSDEQLNEVIADIGGADTLTSKSGVWQSSTNATAFGGQYSYALSNTNAAATAKATITADIPESGYYGVTIWYAEDLNATYDAQFTVIDAAGYRYPFRINQSLDYGRWVWLDRFYFNAGTSVPVMEVTNQSVVANKNVVLDCVRLGGGMGSEDFGGGTSGLPRWQETAVCWTKYSGAPDWVWSAGYNQTHDYYTRFNYADWQRAEVHARLHTNGSTYHTGFGTETFQHAPDNAARLRMNYVLQGIIKSIRSHYRSNWTNRGIKSNTIGDPHILVELGFHDYLTDAEALMDADFRRAAMRGYYEGVLDYFTDKSGVYTPEPPVAPSVRNIGEGLVRAEWTTGTMGGAADSFRIYYSKHPHCYKEYVSVAGSSLSAEIGPLETGVPYYFQLRGENAGGISLPSETLCAVAGVEGVLKRVLLVNGYDRYDWEVDETNNTRNYCIQHVEALCDAATSAGVALIIDSAANEAVAEGRMPLAHYAMVDWMLGLESRVDKNFSADEQAVINGFRSQAGLFFVSGSNVASDLTSGTDVDRDYLWSNFGAGFAGRVSEPEGYAAVGGGLFEGIEIEMEPGVERLLPEADVVETSGSGVVVYEHDGAGGGAGVFVAGPINSVVYFAFPFENVVGADNRRAIMERMLSLVPDKSLVMDWTLY